ncbi:Arabinose-proton symporter [Lecanosticta acicola]|uniref:Arabinose-proton symporter n=1 Tax=Lecanosticta acicola TaxID=111012 RepID=A0AAI9E7Z9_9PEZI|nr:Arabinose-proton symporter [Lecanosticta acicola]
MGDREVDQKAQELISRPGLAKYETVFLKAARILRDPLAWRSIETLDVGQLTRVEEDDLKRDEEDTLAQHGKPPFWHSEFWRRKPRPEHTGTVRATRKPIGFWGQPKELRTAIITFCVAAVVQGWNQTGSNGANLTWPQRLGLSPGAECDAQGSRSWIFAIVNAAPWFSAAIFALLLSDPANELLFGRRAALCFSATCVLAASIGGALVSDWPSFLGCRIVLGIGMGCKASVVPVFAAEVAPARMRGSIVMNWQLFDALGILLGFSANLIVSYLGSDSWRWMTASSVFPTIVLLAFVLVACPESPRFLMAHDEYDEAYETLSRLRGSRILAAKELLYTHYQMEAEHDFSRPAYPPKSKERNGAESEEVHHVEHRDGLAGADHRKPNLVQKLGHLFTVPRIRNATITAFVCMLGQQLCGVNVLIFYSSTLYADTTGAICGRVTQRDLLGPLLMSWGIGLTNFLFAFPAYWLIDRKGRRWLLMVTMPFLCIFLGAAALSYVQGSHNAAFAVFTYLYMAFYSWGMGPVPFTISAEIFPLDHRVVGMSFSVFANLFGAGLLTLFVPAITASPLRHGGLLGIFTFLCLLTYAAVFLFVRETAGAADADNPGNMTALALEELHQIFKVPGTAFVVYQLRQVLPWSVRYLVWWWRSFLQRSHVRAQPPIKPEPLYRWWDNAGSEEQRAMK